MIYHIKVEGLLGEQWANSFDGAGIILKNTGHTVLVCRVEDQAALHGLLRRVRDLGLPLVSVIRVQPGSADAAEITAQGNIR